MKLVYGDQVIENANVTVQTQTKPERLKKLIELTVPADVSNGGYAVSQLLDRDPDIGARAVVTLEVALTQQQIEKLKTITEDELRDIRNGVNPAMIYGVRVYDSEPMDVEEFITGKKWPRWFTLPPGLKDSTGNEMICIRRDSSQSGETFCLGGNRYLWHQWHGDDLQLEEITEPEAQAIIAHSVKPTGEYLGCVQWFQHQNPNVIVRRDSREECTIFDGKSGPFPDNEWNPQCVRNVKSGEWTEITQQEAEQRIEYNRQFSGLTAQEPQPGMCKREQYAGGGTPSPRNCDVCLEGSCPRVIPVQSDDYSDPAFKALRTLAQQCGFDPAGLSAEQIADRVMVHNQNKSVERSFEQLPADREMVIKPDGKSLGCGNDAACLEKNWVTTNEPIRLSACVNHLYGNEPGSDCLCEACGRGPCTRIPVNIIPSGTADLVQVVTDPLYEEYKRFSDYDANREQLKTNDEVWAKINQDISEINERNAHNQPAEPKPIPRNIPNLAFVGIDWAKRRDIAATQHVNTLPFSLGDGPLQLQLRNDFDQEGIWLYVVAGDMRLALVTQEGIDAGKYSFPISCPCIHLCSYPRVKWPVEYRNAAMPKDYGKEVMYFGDFGPEWGRGILRGLRSTGTGREDLIVEIPTETMNGLRTETIDSRRVFVIDAPTEGF